MKNLRSIAKRKSSQKSGMTLVEVVIAMGLFALISVGIYSAGLAALRLTQTSRLMAEAHNIAKQGIESVVAAGYDSFRGGHVPPLTNIVDNATHNVSIIRQTETFLHASNGSVITNPPGTADGYAEVLVHASFTLPGTGRRLQTSLSTILMNEPSTTP